MSTKIDKKDTLDIADGIAECVWRALKDAKIPGLQNMGSHVWIRDIIEEGLNDWISDCETEDADNKSNDIM